jgi:membrane protease YdiL (CAAX protease family)
MQAGEPQPLADETRATEVAFACQTCGRRIAFAGERRGHVETCPHCGEYVDVPFGDRLPPPAATDEPARVEPSSKAAWPSTRWLWFELVAVLCLAVIPPLVIGLLPVAGGERHEHSFLRSRAMGMLFDLQVILPMLLILAMSREPWARFGIVRFSWFWDPAAGGLVWTCNIWARRAAESLLPRSLWLAAPAVHYARWDRGSAVGLLLLAAACLSTGFVEELVIRGYLLTRLERLFRSTGLAILSTTVLFAGCHAYQGARGLVGAAAAGLVYAIAFRLLRRLWPVCIAHALWNFVAMTAAG